MKAGWIVALALGLAAPAASQERSYEEDQDRDAVVFAGEGLMLIGACEQYYDRSSVNALLRKGIGSKPLSELSESERVAREHFGSMYLEGRLFPPVPLDEAQCERVLASWEREAAERQKRH